MNDRPLIHSRIRFDDGRVAEVTEHTERGFKYKGEPSSFIPRMGLSFTGEGEIFTDTPEWKGGYRWFTLVKEETPKHTPILPKIPSPGLLMSMAIRYDHGLGIPGHYDQPFYASSGLTHQQRLDAALTTMRQLYEEVAGYGFYRPELEQSYVNRTL